MKLNFTDLVFHVQRTAISVVDCLWCLWSVGMTSGPQFGSLALAPSARHPGPSCQLDQFNVLLEACRFLSICIPSPRYSIPDSCRINCRVLFYKESRHLSTIKKKTMATKRAASAALGSSLARPTLRAGAPFASVRQHASCFSSKAAAASRLVYPSSSTSSLARKSFVAGATAARPRWYSAGDGASVPGSKRWEFDEIKNQLEKSENADIVFVGTFYFVFFFFWFISCANETGFAWYCRCSRTCRAPRNRQDSRRNQHPHHLGGAELSRFRRRL